MESYGDLAGPAGFQDLNGDAGDRSEMHFAQQPPVAAMGDAQNTTYYGINGQPPMVCDIKPRLTKSQHELLEAEYMRQNKPSTSVKKGFAEKLGVSLDKVNVSYCVLSRSDIMANVANRIGFRTAERSRSRTRKRPPVPSISSMPSSKRASSTSPTRTRLLRTQLLTTSP